MKKFLAMILCLVMVLSLAACGAAEEPAQEPAEEPAGDAAGEETPGRGERRGLAQAEHHPSVRLGPPAAPATWAPVSWPTAWARSWVWP